MIKVLSQVRVDWGGQERQKGQLVNGLEENIHVHSYIHNVSPIKTSMHSHIKNDPYIRIHTCTRTCRGLTIILSVKLTTEKWGKT